MTEIETAKTVALFDRAANRKILENLAKKNIEVLLIEPPTIHPLENSAETTRIFEKLIEYDWLILTNIFAAEITIEKLEAAGIDLFELDKLRICAAGESVADRLRYRQIHADVVANFASAQEVFDNLKSYDNELQSRKIILPIEKDSAPEIAGILRAEQSEVFEVPIYKIVFGDRENLTKTKIKLTGGAADEFVFSSPEEVAYLAKILHAENLAPLISEMKMIALDPATYQTLREFGVSNAVLNVGGYEETNDQTR